MQKLLIILFAFCLCSSEKSFGQNPFAHFLLCKATLPPSEFSANDFLAQAWGTNDENLKKVKALNPGTMAHATIQRPGQLPESVEIKPIPIGEGGSKSFYLVNEGVALALPNMNDSALMASEWLRIVQDELNVTHFISKSGVPVSNIQPVILRFQLGDQEIAFPTYVAPSFDSLAKQGAFVMDAKNRDQTLLRLPSGFRALSEISDPKAAASWIEVLTPLIRDVQRLAKAGYDVDSDTKNLVLVRKGHPLHSGSNAPFEARAFLFDFSNKRAPAILPTQPLDAKKTENLTKFFLDEFLFQEGRIRQEYYGSRELGTLVNDVYRALTIEMTK